MSQYLYMILQKKNKKTGKYKTVVDGIFPGSMHELRRLLCEYGQRELPLNLNDKKSYLGEYEQGYISVKDFCEIRLPEPDASRDFMIEQNSDGYTVTFFKPEDMDEYYAIRQYQYTLAHMLDTYWDEDAEYGNWYRLVWGVN